MAVTNSEYTHRRHGFSTLTELKSVVSEEGDNPKAEEDNHKFKIADTTLARVFGGTNSEAGTSNTRVDSGKEEASQQETNSGDSKSKKLQEDARQRQIEIKRMQDIA